MAKTRSMQTKGETESCGVKGPFTPVFGGRGSMKPAPGTYDRNPSPAFSKPRSMGRNSRPEKFIDGNLGGPAMAGGSKGSRKLQQMR